MSKIAVIGSHSFIAGYVIEELHKRGHSIIGLQRHLRHLEYTRLQLDPFDDQYYLGDITNAEVVERVVSQADYVINLAGILGTSETINNPMPAVEVNILGTLNVLQACRVWNKPFLQIAVGNHWMNNTYSITRTTAERFTLMYAKEHGLKANVVRGLNVYGPRQTFASYKKIIPSFVLAALQNKPLPINGDGMQLMDMIYATDMAKYLVDILLSPEKIHEDMIHMRNNRRNDLDKILETVPQIALDKIKSLLGYRHIDPVEDEITDNIFGNIYQCGAGEGFIVKKIAEFIIEYAKSESQIEYRPMRGGEPVGSVVKADYVSPTFKVSLEEGLTKTIKYYQDNLDKYINAK